VIPAILLGGVSKRYKTVLAVDDVSLAVNPGEVYGLIGPNGAGKTTLLSIVAGLIAPTAGTVAVHGKAIERLGTRGSVIGFASPEFLMFDYLTGREVLRGCGAVHGVPRTEAEDRTEQLLNLLDLQSAADRFVYEYSQGMRQKLGLCAALLHDPAVLLLDEPFDGLDPTSVFQLSHVLRALAASGRTVVISSHDLALVGKLSDRVAVLQAGSLKREVETAKAANDIVPVSPPNAMNGGAQSLESLMWSIVGKPEPRSLSWIRSRE
jgi:ABC-2 type transport system ATP-binding protein